MGFFTISRSFQGAGHFVPLYVGSLLSLVSAVEMIGSKDSLVALTRYKVRIELLQAALEKTIKKIQVENHYTDNPPSALSTICGDSQLNFNCW